MAKQGGGGTLSPNEDYFRAVEFLSSKKWIGSLYPKWRSNAITRVVVNVVRAAVRPNPKAESSERELGRMEGMQEALDLMLTLDRLQVSQPEGETLEDIDGFEDPEHTAARAARRDGPGA